MLPNNIKYEHCPSRLEVLQDNRPFHGGTGVRLPYGRHFSFEVNIGSLAQLVEQLTFNQLVAGSNPARPTILSRHLNYRVT